MTRSIEPLMDFFLREKGEPLSVNGLQRIALIRDAVDKIQETNEKIIRVAIPLHTGDLIDYQNDRYLLISQIDRNNDSSRGRMRKCNYSIAFNFDGNVKWFNGIIEGKSFSIDSGKLFSMPDGTIIVMLQDNVDTRDIVLSQRFYTTHQPFKVVGIDRTNEGIVQLTCSLDLISTVDDDVEHNIADRWKYEIKHTYALTIDNGTTANVLLNDHIPLNITATDNGGPIEHPSIMFTSSDPNVVSVDNKGIVMGIAIGQATILAKLSYHSNVQSAILVTTDETLTHSYSISITGNLTIKMGQSASYVSHIYDNGTEVFDQSVVWSLRNQDDSTPIMGSITTSTGNSASVKAGSSTRYMVLSATLINDPEIMMDKTIQIKGLW